MTGTSSAIRALGEEAQRIVASDEPLLIVGEPGSGKGAIARWVHDQSNRSVDPFVVCDVSTMPQRALRALFGARGDYAPSTSSARSGAFARAQSGTLYIDDVGDLDDACQARLLYAMSDRQVRPIGSIAPMNVNARVIAATRYELELQVSSGRFSADLFERFRGRMLTVPPLRLRREELPEIARRMVREVAESQGRNAPLLTDAAMDAITSHDWPGNLDELRAVLACAVSSAGGASVLDTAQIRIEPGPRSDVAPKRRWPTFKEAKDELLDEWESEYLKALMDRAGGNVTLAAEYSGLARGHLYRLLKKRGLYR